MPWVVACLQASLKTVLEGSSKLFIAILNLQSKLLRLPLILLLYPDCVLVCLALGWISKLEFVFLI